LEDFQADDPVPDDWELGDDLLGEELFFLDIIPPQETFFSSATRHDGAGVGVMLISPKKCIFPYSFTLPNYAPIV